MFQTKQIIKRIGISVILLAFLQIGNSQNAELELAKTLVEQGAYLTALEILENQKSQFPSDLTIVLYHAHVLAWSGALDQSILAFRSILKKDPKNVEALTGLGYALSWSGDFPNALFAFRDALRIEPDLMDAHKGLAFGYLNRGNYVGAKYEFENLVKLYPENKGIQTGLARSDYLLGDTKKATTRLRELLRQNPNASEAKQLLKEIRNKEGGIEVNLWGSYSQLDSVKRIGFRQLQLSYQFKPGSVIYANLDNSLSLDNLDFVISQQQIFATSVGFFHSWNDRFASRLEIGQRSNPNWNHNQFLLKSEQVYAMSPGLILKVGGFVGVSLNNPTELAGWSSVYIPFSKGFSIEPAYFYSKDRIQSYPQHRMLIRWKWAKPGGPEISLGSFYGIQKIEGINRKQDLYGAFLQVLIPISENIWPQLIVHHEEGIFLDGTYLALGIKIKI